MAVNTNFQIPFIPQEGITAQILTAIQAANEQHFQQQRLDVLRQGQQNIAAQRQSQAGLNEARIQNLQAKTQGLAATQDSLNGYRDAKANLANVQAAFQQETAPDRKALLQGQVTIAQAQADQAATRVKFMHNAFHSFDDQIDTAIDDPQQNAGAKAVVDNYMNAGDPEKAIASLQHFVDIAGKPELDAEIQNELAKTPQGKAKLALTGAQTQSAQASAVEKLAAAGKAKAETANLGIKDAYTAYDPARQTIRYATPAEVANPALGLQGAVKLTPGGYDKHVTAASALGDAQLDLSRARVAYDKAGELSFDDKAQVLQLLGDDKFHAEFGFGKQGFQLPVDWFNKLIRNKSYNDLSPAGKEAMVGYLGLQSAAPAYTRALLNSSRQSDTTMKIEEKLLMDPSVDTQTRNLAMSRFQAKIDQLDKAIPEMPGIQKPRDIRQGIETQPVINNMNMLMDRLGQSPAQAPGAGGLSGYVPPQQ